VRDREADPESSIHTASPRFHESRGLAAWIHAFACRGGHCFRTANSPETCNAQTAYSPASRWRYMLLVRNGGQSASAQLICQARR